ncbi:YadA-like family protein [Bartonella sp. MM20NXGY]|uniref:YadA-like family protein n=1 Tax=Bartonella sp. MM20NXGY TaxID=3243551 RepID=UPI0035D0F544
MKKILYTTPHTLAVSNLKNSCSSYRLPFIKTLSLVSVAAFLSNASPVFACDLWGNVAQYFGGGTNIRKSIAPTYIINGKIYRDVGSALYGLENYVAETRYDKFVKQDASGLITIGADVGGNRITIANSSHGLRTLTGVADGWVSPISYDAVNGSQLFSQGISTAISFGGGAGYDRKGNWIAPTFTVKVFDKNGNGTEKDYKNVADAFTGVSSSFTNLDKKIENIVIDGTGDNLVKQDDTGLITIGGKVSGARVNIANVDNVARTLAGVKAGSITATSTDAINGSQFYAMSNVVAGYLSDNAGYDKDGNWNAPTFTVKVFDKNGSGTEKNYQNVGDALSGVSSSFTNLNQKIESVTGDSFVRQNSVGLITIGGDKGGDRIDIANGINFPRVLSGVKGGAFTATSTEAVNGGQIYFMAQAFAHYFGGGAGYDKAGKWSDPTFTVKAFDKNGNETEKNYTNVADAFSGVNSAFTSLNEEIVKIKDSVGIIEKSYTPQDNSSDIISEGFPFMRSARFLRSLPLAIDEEESAIDEADNSTTVTVAPSEILEKSTYEVTDYQFSQMNNKVTEVEKNVTNVTDRVTEVEKKVNVAVSYDTDDSGKKINSITLKGVDDSEPVLITNVQGGKIEHGSKDAVNGGQLYDHTAEQMKITLESAKRYTKEQVDNGVNAAKSYTDMKFDALSYDITNVRKEARQAAAIGLAVSNLRYFDDPGSVSVSFGGGFWRGQSAFAIGAGYTSEDGKIRSNLSATSAGGQWGVGGGITLKLK